MADYPFLNPRFFTALEQSRSTVESTGWTPCHQVIQRNREEIAFMPLYEKTHSMGEYVFDWSWADAYRRAGLPYYPKLLTAIPFTPATGPRVRFNTAEKQPELCSELIDNTLAYAQDINASSWHLLFPDEQHLAWFEDPRLLLRKGVQYHWFNRGYNQFDDFLAQLTSRKRKMIRKERRQVEDQGFVIERLTGEQISAGHWQRFALFYQRTYLKRSGSTGYLTPSFFELIGKLLGEQCLMVTASRDDDIVAAAFYFFDEENLYGRYWGCAREYDFLHFELCYYQGIDFAIENRLHKFDAGAQGEHKVVRGFEPVTTHSLHWIAHSEFRRAVARFLQEEESYIEHHLKQAEEMLPYKQSA